MMRPTILLAALLATDFSSSLAGAAFVAAAARTNVPESSLSVKVRKAAAAGIPPGQRKLDFSACYTVTENMAVKVDCVVVGTCALLNCCDDEESCIAAGAGGSMNYNGFEVVSNSQTGCNSTWVYGLCS